MGKSTISMAIFNCYVSSPEGMSLCPLHLSIYIYIYIYRVKAGGSPEADCKSMVWRWKMLMLYCVLQCFLLSLERVPAVKVSMSARINSEFVRAEK